MKDCLILGPLAATWYKGTTELLISKELKLGYSRYRCQQEILFTEPNGNEKGVQATWYTTLDVNRKEEDRFVPTVAYDETEYQRYDNYDAIEIKPYGKLPKDYDGERRIGVVFFYFYPELDYEIKELRADLKINGKKLFQRLIIQKRK